jgi:hypothetical protein
MSNADAAAQAIETLLIQEHFLRVPIRRASAPGLAASCLVTSRGQSRDEQPPSNSVQWQSAMLIAPFFVKRNLPHGRLTIKPYRLGHLLSAAAQFSA